MALVALALAPNMFLGVHFNRYLLWAFPGLLVLAAVGPRRRRPGCSPAATRRSTRPVPRAARRCSSCWACSPPLRFAVIYGDMAGDVYRRDVAAAEWIARNLPPGVAMANLATSVEYLTGHRNLNLHGVTSPAFFGDRADRARGGRPRSRWRGCPRPSGRPT